MKHIVLAVSDIHAGSTVGLCPPEGIPLEDGGHYSPSEAQLWLWSKWREMTEQFARLLDLERPDGWTLVVNGDLTEGNHHGTYQISSPLEGDHFRSGANCLRRGPLELKPDKVHVIRGTEAHVGKAAQLEEGVARVLEDEGYPIVHDPDHKDRRTSFARRFRVAGVEFECKHHGRGGHRAHTRGSMSHYYAQDIALEYIFDGEKPPDVAIRSHLHTAGVYRHFRLGMWLIQTPCFQLATSYTYRVAIEKLADIGVVPIVVEDGYVHEPRMMLYRPSRPTVIAYDGASPTRSAGGSKKGEASGRRTGVE